jgi:hypothetical protein
MAISSGQITVGTASVAIDGVWHNPSRITIQNLDNSDTCFIGNSNVSPTNGLGLTKLEMIQFDLAPLEQLHVVSTKSNHTIAWLRQTI